MAAALYFGSGDVPRQRGNALGDQAAREAGCAPALYTGGDWRRVVRFPGASDLIANPTKLVSGLHETIMR